MSDCVFCRIGDGSLPADVVAEGDAWVAFRDLQPQAPTHLLIIPRRHVATANDLVGADDALMGELVRAAAEIAAREGVAEAGYRLVCNTNRGAGQSVFHLHLHLLAGRPLAWPPG
ncbi:MAG: histidine triad nucleotide-binding protein [Gemmatimonadota bacterium]